MKDEIDRSVELLRGSLEVLAEAAQQEAQEICGPFWERSQEIRSQERPKEWFKYGVSVRQEEAANGTTRVRVLWLEITWAKVNDPTRNSQFIMRSKQMRKNAAGRYTIGMFKKAGPEEKALIQVMLEQLDKVYDTLKIVGSMKKSLSNTYRKYQND